MSRNHSQDAHETPGRCEETAVGALVGTACGDMIVFTNETPCSVYEGKPVYFCLPACKEDFERDPSTSCMADRIPPPE